MYITNSRSDAMREHEERGGYLLNLGHAIKTRLDSFGAAVEDIYTDAIVYAVIDDEATALEYRTPEHLASLAPSYEEK